MAVNANNPTLRAAIEGYKINGDLTIMDYPRRRKAILDDRTRAEINDERLLQRQAQASLTRTNREDGVIDSYKNDYKKFQVTHLKQQES